MPEYSEIKQYAIGAIIGCIIGIIIGYSFHPDTRVEYVKGDPEAITETTTQHEETQIQYVPKESPSDADVEMNDAPQKVSVKVNGKTTKFNTVENETQKFEKGKLVVDKTSQISFDIKAPEQPRVEAFINGVYGPDKRAVELQGEAQKSGWKAEASVNTSGDVFFKLGHRI